MTNEVNKGKSATLHTLQNVNLDKSSHLGTKHANLHGKCYLKAFFS